MFFSKERQELIAKDNEEKSDPYIITKGDVGTNVLQGLMNPVLPVDRQKEDRILFRKFS